MATTSSSSSSTTFQIQSTDGFVADYRTRLALANALFANHQIEACEALCRELLGSCEARCGPAHTCTIVVRKLLVSVAACGP
jgi:dihydroneopterin aldolase